MTITYSARISTTFLAGEVITNTADLKWTSLPGTGTPSKPTGQTPPGGSGDEDGERNGDGGVNYYDRDDNAEITVENNTTASLGDYVWEGTNADGIQDAGEPGIPGVTVNLIVNDVIISTTTRITNGCYIFPTLESGVPYLVEVVRPGAHRDTQR